MSNTGNDDTQSELDEQIDGNNEKLNPRPIREILIGGIGFILFLTVMVFAINAVGVDNLQQFIQDAGPWAPIFYITLKAITYVFAPLTSNAAHMYADTSYDNSCWLTDKRNDPMSSSTKEKQNQSKRKLPDQNKRSNLTQSKKSMQTQY